MIAKKLQLPADTIEGITLGGLIHDIGKISTPSEILTKPTQLLAAEYALVKEHPSIGADFFSNIKLRWPVKTIVEQHHERLDGSGYPKGLTGKDIILEARVVAVADVIDSMAANRPYRFAPGINAAIDELRDGKGIKYDESVVEAVLALHESDELPL
ncbi:MAG: HD domain-containing phosphohydrolase [Kangiellaceae bacterium]|jgi:HD-GYP domain-containing protein (c-di-GMP phosphodiesterase class II)|nr:HD domain-containing phosphohydrolase [Kangiellaceae bacterium]